MVFHSFWIIETLEIVITSTSKMKFIRAVTHADMKSVRQRRTVMKTPILADFDRLNPHLNNTQTGERS